MQTFKPFQTIDRHFAHHEEASSGDRRGAASFNDEMDKTVASGLAHAAPHFWTRHMCHLLEQTAEGLPAWTLRPEDLGVAAGYLWFEEPLVILDAVNRVVDGERLQALLWCAVERVPERMTGNPWAMNANSALTAVDPGYMIVPFTTFTKDSVSVLGQPFIDVSHGTPRTPLAWYLGQTLQDFQDGLERLYAGFDFRRQIRAVAGMPPAFHHQQMLKFGRYFAAAVALMNQTLVAVSPYRGDRAGRRRVRAITPPTIPDPEVVRAVELRRREYVKRGQDAEPEPVDWQLPVDRPAALAGTVVPVRESPQVDPDRGVREGATGQAAQGQPAALRGEAVSVRVTPLVRRQRVMSKLEALARLMNQPIGKAAREVSLAARRSFYEMDDATLDRWLDRCVKEWRPGGSGA